MNLEELHSALVSAGIPSEKYYLHGLLGTTDDENKLSVIVRRGRYFREFVVYYRERGEMHSVRVFDTESKACEYMFKRLTENKALEDKWYDNETDR